ncbi:MAG: hypoxanthine phosphoribosyltransferase [Bacteroidaceae bacterium]|jgi:hypoxanthine phosphoribosyltransferase|nr:hypoxanthine phosphoribosyltransferase [Bacteroidaceae bacterium]
MSTIKIHDREFVRTIPAEEIAQRVKGVAERINKDYAGKRPLLIGVLNGCFMFVSDLMKNLEIECEVSFVKFSSYQGAETTGNVKQLLGLSESIEGRDVIIVEDIVDTGLTMHKMLETLEEKKPASLAVASLFLKPARLRVPVEVKYSAFEIPDRFIVGYGLDYDGLGRNLPDVYDVKE